MMLPIHDRCIDRRINGEADADSHRAREIDRRGGWRKLCGGGCLAILGVLQTSR